MKTRKSRQVVASTPRALRFAGLGVALVGALILVATVLFHRREVERERSLVPAQGTVVEQRDRNVGSARRVVLTIRFTTAAGETVRFESSYGARTTPRPAMGDTVTVLYDPRKPTQAEVQDTSRLGLALVGAVGVGFLLMGSTLLFRAFRPRAAMRR
jgi:hypothetical protein